MGFLQYSTDASTIDAATTKSAWPIGGTIQSQPAWILMSTLLLPRVACSPQSIMRI